MIRQLRKSENKNRVLKKIYSKIGKNREELVGKVEVENKTF